MCLSIHNRLHAVRRLKFDIDKIKKRKNTCCCVGCAQNTKTTQQQIIPPTFRIDSQKFLIQLQTDKMINKYE
jgi:hypothetical protein